MTGDDETVMNPDTVTVINACQVEKAHPSRNKFQFLSHIYCRLQVLSICAGLKFCCRVKTKSLVICKRSQSAESYNLAVFKRVKH